MGHASNIAAARFGTGIYKEGILDFLFKSKSKEEEIPFEIDRYRISVDDCKYRIKIIMRDGTLTNAADLFKNSKKLIFSRFFISEEGLPKPQFAPSLEEAIDWFIGKGFPKDGDRHTPWGKISQKKCAFCESMVSLPFHIKKVDCLIIYRQVPDHNEIVGWRVSEVESALGIGIPTKYFTLDKDHAVIKWNSSKKKIICKRCAERFAENYRKDELDNFIILEEI
jgi:hypothetical protein